MIQNLRLQHFRSYDDESFEFEDRVNIVVGPNASGKTNLLEAILMLCKGSSYRAKDAEVIAYDKPWARVDAQLQKESRTLKLSKEADERVKKEFVISDQTFKRLSYQKTIPFVLFEPNHLQLLSGSPEHRRDYLDDLLEKLVLEFKQMRRQYKRTLAQRNALLKHATDVRGQLFAWNVRLGALGSQIALKRLTLIDQLNEQLSTIYGQLAHQKTKVRISYRSSCKIDNYGSDLLHKLETGVELDIQRGFTSYGPHRDDWNLILDEHPVEHTASRGETRTLLLALKLLELSLVEQTRNQKPILLLDDVFSELDGARRRALTETLKTHQTFITTTDADVVLQYFMDECRIIPTTG